MIALGVDVILLAAFGCALVIANAMLALLLPMSQEQGEASIKATAWTAMFMVVFYVVVLSA